MIKEEVMIDIEKFVLFHKKRISLLKGFVKDKIHGRLVFQISFLGFESLAKLLYPKENSSKERFIELLSQTIRRDESTNLYNNWRNSLTHQGFVVEPWNTLEMWGEEDDSFLIYSENKTRSSKEYPPGSILAMYKFLVDHLDKFFKEINTKKVKFPY